MRNNRRHDLKRSQQSVFWYLSETQDDPELRKVPDYYSRMYTSMLIDDVRNSVMPFHDHIRKPFTVTLSPPDQRAEDLIADAIKRQDYGINLPDTLHSFMDLCASTLIANEEAYYEIAYFLDEEDKKVAFELTFIPAGTVIHDGNNMKQYVPANIAQQRELPSQYLELAPERILIFTLPEYVRQGFNSMMDFLAGQSDVIVPGFYMDNLRNTQNKVPFDQEKFHRTQKMALYDATKLIGYNFRDYNMEHITEYYLWHRDLVFEKFKVTLRNSILATLNDGITRAGKELGFSSQIEIKGLPTEDDVAAAQEKLAVGDGTFEEILKTFRYY